MKTSLKHGKDWKAFLQSLPQKRGHPKTYIEWNFILKTMKAQVHDKTAYMEAEIQFHLSVVKAAKNVILEDIMEKMNKLLHESRKRTLERFHDIYKESYLKHLNVYTAIKEMDPKQARKAMVEHLSYVEDLLKSPSPQ